MLLLEAAVKQFLVARANIEAIMPEPPSENQTADILLTEHHSRFLQDEMLICGFCGRSVPPNRTTCMYCGKPLESASIDKGSAKINVRSPEAWEDGFSLVYSGKDKPSAETIAVAAAMMQVDHEKISRVLDSGIVVPLIYLKFLPDAELLASRLSEIGFGCAIVGDDLLQARTPPTRVRSVIFEENAVLLENFNNGEYSRIDADVRVLLVTGVLLKTSNEVAGKLKKGNLKRPTETLSATDELVLDLYPPNDVYGYRLRTSGFDFSCLKEKMQPLAGANIKALIDELRSRMFNQVFIDSFNLALPQLRSIWPVRETKRSGSVSRGTLGGVHKESVFETDNTEQFTKFSRLQRHFI